MMWRSISCGLLLLFAGCVPANRFEEGGGTPPSGSGTMVSVAWLKSQYRGYPLRVAEDIDVQGVVTANDCYGMFRNTLVIQDATGGIEVKVGGDRLFTVFPVGQTVRIRCRELVLGDYGGVVSLGTASDDPAYANGFIAQQMWPQCLKKEGGVTDFCPDTLVFRELTPASVSCCVAFDRVQFVDEECVKTWCDAEQDTDRHLVNPEGDTLIVRTSFRADFAAVPLPFGSGYIEGILSWFNGKYQLKIVTPKNAVMESPRFRPVLRR